MVWLCLQTPRPVACPVSTWCYHQPEDPVPRFEVYMLNSSEHKTVLAHKVLVKYNMPSIRVMFVDTNLNWMITCADFHDSNQRKKMH